MSNNFEPTTDPSARVQEAQALLNVSRENQFSPRPILGLVTANIQSMAKGGQRKTACPECRKGKIRCRHDPRTFKSITENNECAGKPSGHHQAPSSTENIHKKRKHHHKKTVNPESLPNDPKAQPAKPSIPVDTQEDGHPGHQALSPERSKFVQYTDTAGPALENPLSGTDAGICDPGADIFRFSHVNPSNHLLHDAISQIRIRISEEHKLSQRKYCQEQWSNADWRDYYDALGIPGLNEFESAAFSWAQYDPAFTFEELWPISYQIGQGWVKWCAFKKHIKKAVEFVVRRGYSSHDDGLLAAQHWFMANCDVPSYELIKDTWCDDRTTNWGIQKAIDFYLKDSAIQGFLSEPVMGEL